MPKFTDETVERIFGHEAAEDEKPARLMEYYFKAKAFEQVTADLNLRILVGHKGIGKSALFKVAMHEDGMREKLAVLIRPDDIEGIGLGLDFLALIREWKKGLMSIIASKVAENFGQTIDKSRLNAQVVSGAGSLLEFIGGLLSPLLANKININPAKMSLIKAFLQKKQINIYIDDLDRGWEANLEGIKKISSLLNALRDLANDNSGLRFKVALRTDVYYSVKTSDESTDKIEGAVIWYTWENHEILALLAKRIITYLGKSASEQDLIALKQELLAKNLHYVMEPRFNAAGKWQNIPVHRMLMSLIRRRPRDLVKLCTLAAHHAYRGNRELILTKDFQGVFEEYSQGRIQDTINEFRSELPELERLLLNMKPNRKERRTAAEYLFSTQSLTEKLTNIQQGGRFYKRDKTEMSIKDLIAFLYKIDFIIARKSLADGSIVRKYYDQNKFLSNQFVDYGYEWEVHPAYRWALQPDSIEKVFEQLDVGD